MVPVRSSWVPVGTKGVLRMDVTIDTQRDAGGAEFVSGAIVARLHSSEANLQLQDDLEDRIKNLEDKLNKIAEIINPSEETSSSSQESESEGPGGTGGIRCD